MLWADIDWVDFIQVICMLCNSSQALPHQVFMCTVFLLFQILFSQLVLWVSQNWIADLVFCSVLNRDLLYILVVYLIIFWNIRKDLINHCMLQLWICFDFFIFFFFFFFIFFFYFFFFFLFIIFKKNWNIL